MHCDAGYSIQVGEGDGRRIRLARAVTHPSSSACSKIQGDYEKDTVIRYSTQDGKPVFRSLQHKSRKVGICARLDAIATFLVCGPANM